jgi:hypothetical protein
MGIGVSTVSGEIRAAPLGGRTGLSRTIQLPTGAYPALRRDSRCIVNASATPMNGSSTTSSTL